MFSTPKKQKSNATEKASNSEIDRISNLPDELRLQILSFLPTKSAVATSILSTQWKNLFSLIPSLNLDFEDYKARDSTKKCSFISSVDRVFKVILHDVSNMNSFRLRCDPDYEVHYLIWFQAAIRLNIQRLDFRLAPMKNSKMLLHTFFGCQTLVYLSFGYNNCIITIPRCGANLPNLKELFLETPIFSGPKSFETLVSGCPVLERLTLHDCSSHSVKCLHICSPLLKYFDVIADFSFCIDAAFEIVLHTPNLESLICSGSIIECCEGKKLDFQLRADINCSPIPHKTAWKDLKPMKTKFQQKLEEFIMACPNLASLVLRKHSMFKIPRLIDNIFVSSHKQGLYHSSPPLPPLYNLRWLELIGMDVYGWKRLPGMLAYAPNLESLSIEGEFSESCYESFSTSLRQVLPTCLSLHLKQVCFSSFHWQEDDSRLIEYFLQKAVVLQKMKIMVKLPRSWGVIGEISLLKDLSMLPRNSMTCQIFWRCSWDMQWLNLHESF